VVLSSREKARKVMGFLVFEKLSAETSRVERLGAGKLLPTMEEFFEDWETRKERRGKSGEALRRERKRKKNVQGKKRRKTRQKKKKAKQERKKENTGRKMQSQVPLSKLMFKKYDKDGSGKIDAQEFKMLCYDLGHALSDHELMFALKMIDRDGSGFITYEEYQKWWSSSDKWGKLHLSEEQAIQPFYFHYFLSIFFFSIFFL
jgi:tRNA(Met) C34 N-acetyltransferase TmcA